MSFPLIPGFYPNQKVLTSLKPGHHRPGRVTFREGERHVLDYESGTRDLPRSGLSRRVPRRSFFPRGEGPALPSWVAFDKQVLRFYAFCQEGVTDSSVENYRIRQCKIYFYLEDDTVQVTESRTDNSGIAQGTIIRRHRVPLPPPDDYEFYTIEYFNVGRTVELYGKAYRIIGCDTFTRNFLTKLGVQVGCDEEVPADQHTEHRKKVVGNMQPLRPYDKVDTLAQFLANDGKVLRFWGYWEDSEKRVRDMEFLYHLADDTVEVRERYQPNCGRDHFPKYLNRGRLPKKVEPIPLPGVIAPRTVLNTFGTIHGKNGGSRYILDNLRTGHVDSDFYTDRDLCIGATINLYNRRLVLTDCDEFTRQYYRQKYGAQDMTPIQYKKEPPPEPKKEIPPHNGFGSEEDSLSSYLTPLIPTPPKRDFHKFMEKDRNGMDGNILRFKARLLSSNDVDRRREFVISFFLRDDSIMVYETPMENSGVIAGKFMERTKVKVPQQRRINCPSLPDYYQPTDFYIGAEVVFKDFKFLITDADEYTLNYMEKHTGQFSQSNINAILRKLKSSISAENMRAMGKESEAGYTDGSGFVSLGEMLRLLQHYSGSALTEHEKLVLGRHFRVDEVKDELSMDDLLGAIHEGLRKERFTEFDQLESDLLHHDFKREGRLLPHQIKYVCRQQKLPVNLEYIDEVLSRLPPDEHGKVSYCEFLQLINYQTSSRPPPKRPIKIKPDWARNGRPPPVTGVDFRRLMEALTPDLCVDPPPPQMPEIDCGVYTSTGPIVNEKDPPDPIPALPQHPPELDCGPYTTKPVPPH